MGKEKKKWYQTGEFEDGYQFGDIFRTVKNSISGKEEEEKKNVEQKREAIDLNPTVSAVKDGRLDFDLDAQMYGFANSKERKEYIEQNPELYVSMGGYKYVPAGTPIRNTESITNSNKAIERIVERFKNTDSNKVQKAIEKGCSGQWLDADTMKMHTDVLNSYVNDYIALEKLGYFDSLPEDERKGYIDALKIAKKMANDNKKIFADYKDSNRYRESVNNYIEYEKVKNGNLEELEKELRDWEKEWNAWNEGTNSSLGDKEWIMHEWRFNNDGQRTIPYDATSYPEIFMGKTITEAEEIINKRREYLRLAKKDIQINTLTNEAYKDNNFEEISNYKVCNSEKELLEKYDTKDFDSNNINLLLDYLCTDSKSVRDSITNHKYTSYLEIYGVMSAERVNMLTFDWSQKGYDQLNDEEKKIVKYFAKNDPEKLYKYLELNEETWKNRGAKKIAESLDGNILAKASYAIAGSGDRIRQSMVGALNYITGKEDYVEPTKTQLTSQYIRQNLDGFGGFLYDATGAITYMTPAILMNAILPGSGFAVTGITAAGGAYNDGIKMGMTRSQARTYGTLIGVSETVLSKMFSGIAGLNGNITKIGLEKITSGINNGILRFVATIGVNAATEGFEEFAQEVLEPLFENIALGYNKNDLDDIDWNSAVYNGLIGAFLGSTSNVVTTINDTFGSNKSVQKLDPNEVIEGIWEDSPNKAKNIVEKSQLESVREKEQLILENLTYNKFNDSIEMFRKGSTHRRLSNDNNYVIDKPTYHKITNPIIKQGADIRIADDEWLQHLKMMNASAVTIGDVIFLREDATVSDVLEETYHFLQNKKGLNNQYNEDLRTILNEIDAKEYLLSMTEKYHIPDEEVVLTKQQLEYYKYELNNYNWEN